MLRIRQVSVGSTEATLFVEGRIVSSWVPVLEDECSRVLQEPGRRLRLDLSAVMFVDDEGVLALRRLASYGVEIANPPTFVQALLTGDGAS
jgi:hypothetical protein